MTYVLQNVAQYAIVILASVFQNVYQDAVNATALHAFAFQAIAVILAAVFAFALHANAILEEDAILHADMFVTTIAR